MAPQMAAYRIEISTPNDADRVTDLIAASYTQLWQDHYPPDVLSAALPMMTQANPVLLASRSYYIAVTEQGDVVGCGGWTHERPGNGRTKDGLAHLRHFATHPQWLRQSIGKALYARCEADAKEQGVSKFECYSSLPAVPFYRRLGFKRTRKIAVPVGTATMLESVIMKRSI